jgi:hypothetical protein
MGGHALLVSIVRDGTYANRQHYRYQLQEILGIYTNSLESA